MWARAIVALVAASLLFIALLRDDLPDLAESVRTYTAFYPYLERHPELLYRLPSDPVATASKEQNELVPPILHRIDLSKDQADAVSKQEDRTSSCQILHPNWTHMTWTDENATKFMTNLYPDLLARYKDRRRSAEYANILKYALLDHYGGVFLNLDIACLQPLDELRGIPFLTTGAYPAGVSKAFILSKPQHPFLRRMLEGEQRRSFIRRPRWIGGLFNTGSMEFSNSWMRYVQSMAKKGCTGVTERGRVYVLADEHGNLDIHVLSAGSTSPLFHRKGASRLKDLGTAAFITVATITKHNRYFLGTMGLGAVCMTLWLWTKSGRRRDNLPRMSLVNERKILKSIEEGEYLLGMKGG